MYPWRINTWKKDGKLSSPSSTHKVVPFNNFRRKDSTKTLGKRSQDPALFMNYHLLHKQLVFLNHRQSITPTATQSIWSKGSYQGFLAAVSCLLQPLPCCRVVSTSVHSLRDFPLYEMALQHHKSHRQDCLPISTPLHWIQIAFNLMAPKYAA